MKKIKLIISLKKGSSIIMALLVMVILALLGLGVTTITLGTLKSNVADSSQNEAYYAAESGISSAINQLKYEVVSYYSSMALASSTEYSVLYSNFFSNINVNAQTNFIEPTLESVTTSTTFYAANFDADDSICEFQIQCVSTTADDAQYQVNASVYIKKIDINASSDELIMIDNAALIAGNLLNIEKKCGFVVNGGDVIVKEVTYDSSWVPYLINGGNLYLDNNIGNSVTDILDYTSYIDPDMSNPNAYITTNTTFNWGSIPASPVKIVSTSGADIHVNSCIISGGVIHSGGDIHMNNSVFTVDLYSDGDIHINNCTINGNIYCRGNFYGNNAVINGSVISEGFVDWLNGAMNGSVYGEFGVDIQDASGIGDIISPNLIELKRTGINGGLVYSSTKIIIGDCSIKAVIYSLGDVEINRSFGIQGAIIAKQDVFYDHNNLYFTINYSPELIEDILGDTDYSFFSQGEGASGSLDDGIFVSHEITPVG